MGVFSVKAVIWSPQNPSRRSDIELLVDTGSTYTVIPMELLRGLGVASVRVVRLRLADGRVIERPLGEVGIEIEGVKATATPAVFGEGETSLLGSVTMEQLGLAPDPIEKRLKTVEALLMAIKTKGQPL